MPVRVLNISDQPKRFKKGSALATPVTSVVSVPKGASIGDLAGHKIEVPDSLQSLYERSVTIPSGDLGHTDLVWYKINRGDAPPIRQPSRWLPSLKQDEAHKAVTEMLEKGLIESSTSPWALPVVLIKKKRWQLEVLC